MALTKDDLKAVRSIVRDETDHLATKDNVASVKDDIADLAGMTKREFDRVHEALDVYVRRVEKVEERIEKLAQHVGFTFDR